MTHLKPEYREATAEEVASYVGQRDVDCVDEWGDVIRRDDG